MSTKDWAEKDYYKVLGVSKDAKPEEIKKAFRKIARDNHPDSHPGDKAAEARFKEASEANDVLSNVKKRKEYDQARSLFGTASRFGFPRGGAQPNVNVEDFIRTASNGDGFGDLFGNLFGATGGRRTTTRAARRGADVEGETTISFDDAVSGTTVTMDMVSQAPCQACRGTGARAGTVPRGVEDGQRIRIKGKGSPGENGGRAGDLYVKVTVRPHQVFGRDGNNLTVDVPVTFPEAALGAEVEVPTLAGSTVRLRIPAGTPSGRTFRVRGRGVPRSDGSKGDLLATVEIVVPEKLDDDARHALEGFRDVVRQPNPRPWEVR